MYGIEIGNKKRVNTMAMAKIYWWLLDTFGWSATFLGIALNIDNIKSAILFILSVSYLMLRGYFYWVQKQQSVREKELDIWDKEQNKIDRINKRKN